MWWWTTALALGLAAFAFAAGAFWAARRRPRLPSELLHALDGLQSPALLLDAADRIVEANAAAGQLLDRAPADLADTSLADVIQGDPHDGAAREWPATALRGDAPGLPVTLHRSNLDSAHTLVTLEDRAESERATTQLRITERALHAAASGIVICDAQRPDHPMIYVNRAFETLTGYTPAEALGRNCRFLNERDADQPGLVKLREALSRCEEVTVVLRNFRKDGTAFWNELSISPITDKSGTTTHFIGIQDDITERMEFGAERERLLAESLADRESAARAAKARETLLAVVSHELRSPLNSIRLWNSLLEGATPTDTATRERALKQIDDAVSAQSRIIEDLLDTSRIESGRMEFDMRLTDLADVATRVCERSRPAANDRRIELRLSLVEGDSSVHGDPARLTQAVQNLVDNALKFSPEGSAIDVEVREAASDTVRLTVQDQGEGIPPERLQTIFEPFWQGSDNEDRRPHGGLGLGLSLVRQIVEAHGGTVEADSLGLDRGTSIRLELRRATAAPTPTTTAPPLAAERPRPEGDILVVDDDSTTTEALSLGLHMKNFASRTCSSAEAALREIERATPRILVSDIQMGGLSGLDLIRAVRLQERERNLPRLPAIAISGRGQPDDARRVRVAGFDAFLAKPVRLDALLELIQEHWHAPTRHWRPGTVILAGDDRANSDRMRETLILDGHEVQVVQTAAGVHALADDQTPDAIVAMPRLLDGRGEDVLAWARDNLGETLAVRVAGASADAASRADVTLSERDCADELRKALHCWLR